MPVILEPNKYRDRKNINAKVPPNFEHILNSKSGPRIQFQFNDKNDRCIGRSMVLKPENNELEGLIFVPVANKYDDGLIIPFDAKSIVIFGQQGLFASKSDLECTYKKESLDEYIPTIGIEQYGPIYLNRPYNFFLANFNIQTGERYDDIYVKDIVNSIEFSEGYFKKLKTIEPINLVK